MPKFFKPHHMRFHVFLGLFLLSSLAFAQLDSIFDQGEHRTFLVHLPQGHFSNQQYPIVLNLHGLGSNARQQQSLTQFNSVADSFGFLVVYPNGTPIAKGSNSWSTVGNTDADFLSHLVDSIRAAFPTNDCLFVMGMSQGGFMTYKFANTTKHSVAGIAVGSGNMSKALQRVSTSAPRIPVLHFHGTADSVVPFAGTPPLIPPVDSTIQWWIKHNQCSTKPIFSSLPNTSLTDSSKVERYEYRGGTNASNVTFYKVLNGGHTWSGSTSIPIFGHSNQDIHQSNIIGNFFNAICSKTSDLQNLCIANSLHLFPNPSNNQLNVEMMLPGEYRLRISDLLGKILIDIPMGNKAQIDMTNFKRGIYRVRVDSDTYHMSKKIVLQ